MRIILVILVSLISLPAFAAVGNVGKATVDKGVASVETRMSLYFDERPSQDRKFNSHVHFDYGVTDDFGFRLIATQTQAHGDNLEHSDARGELHFQVFDAETDGFDGAFRLEYVREDGANGADQARVRLAAAKAVDDLKYTTNLIVGHQIGAERVDGLSAEWRWSIFQKLGNVWGGVEAYHNLGNLHTTEGWETQSHQIGPVVSGKIVEGWKYKFGYLHGISRGAPDKALKLFLVRNF